MTLNAPVQSVRADIIATISGLLMCVIGVELRLMTMANCWKERRMTDKSTKGLKACAEWLCYCLSIGWKMSQLDDLEKLWWKYHDGRTGELTHDR